MRAVLVGVSLCGLPGRLSADPNGWAVGFGGTIVHTSDGGATWAPQTSGTDNALFSVEFTDALNGWAVGDLGTIVHTSDGGATWVTQPNPVSGTMIALFSVEFTDASNGWAVGDNGTIVHTSDGGATWSGQDSGTLNGLLCVAVATPAPVPNAPARSGKARFMGLPKYSRPKGLEKGD